MYKRTAIGALTVLSILFLGGCVQMHQETVIKEDGSGTASLTISLSAVMTEAMAEWKEMGETNDGKMDLPDFSTLTKEDLEEAAKGRGVKVEHFEKGLVDGRETVDLNLEFEDLEGLSFVLNRVMGEEAGNSGMGIFADDDGNFVLKAAEYDFPPPAAKEAAEETPGEMAEEDLEVDPDIMQKQMAIMGKLMGAMSELEVSMKITVPGEVISSNAPLVEGNTSIWQIDANNAMSAGNDMEPEIVFSGKGLKIKTAKE